MIGESKQEPKQFQRSRGGWFFRYNIQTITRPADNGNEETFHQFDEVWIPKKDEETLVIAIIRTRYSANDEFKMNRLAKTTTEWKDYDAFATEAVNIAKSALGLI